MFAVTDPEQVHSLHEEVAALAEEPDNALSGEEAGAVPASGPQRPHAQWRGGRDVPPQQGGVRRRGLGSQGGADEA